MALVTARRRVICAVAGGISDQVISYTKPTLALLTCASDAARQSFVSSNYIDIIIHSRMFYVLLVLYV